jgi:hypothetical protein
MCYCDSSDEEILQDLLRDGVPEEALTRSCCWKRVCQVRGRNFNQIDPEIWSRICTERGYLLQRQNPRGF